MKMQYELHDAVSDEMLERIKSLFLLYSYSEMSALYGMLVRLLKAVESGDQSRIDIVVEEVKQYIVAMHKATRIVHELE